MGEGELVVVRVLTLYPDSDNSVGVTRLLEDPVGAQPPPLRLRALHWKI